MKKEILITLIIAILGTVIGGMILIRIKKMKNKEV